MTAPRALQLYYTSCRRGASGHAGFQTRAHSEGISLTERRELEAKALYNPPLDLPREPDADTIAEKFPKAFRHFVLASGRVAAIRSAYCGRDYSGRWGNYFAHALIFDGSFEQSWIIDAYGWPGWIEGLANDADAIEPEPLPPLQSAELLASAYFSFEELKTFLSEEDGRVGLLSRMIAAAFRRPVDSRSIVIRARLELDGASWIACITKAFPARVQRHLSCSTYQFDPRGAFAINATYGETQFSFDSAEQRFQFYVFDFVTNSHSELTDDAPEYATILARWMSTDPERTASFHSFAAHFDYSELDDGLGKILRLFMLARREPIVLDAQEFHELLEFARAHALPEAFAQMLDVLGDVTERLTLSSPAGEWTLAVRFLADGAGKTRGASHRRRACKAWVNAFDALVVRTQRDQGDVLSLRDAVEAQLGRHARELSETFMDAAYIDTMYDSAATLTPQTLRIVVNEIDRACRQLSRSPREPIFNLIAAVLSRLVPPYELNWAFAAFGKDPNDLAAVTLHMDSVLARSANAGDLAPAELDAARRGVGAALARFVETSGDRVRFDVVNRIKREARARELLFGEWQARFERGPDRLAAQAAYERDVLSDGSEYASVVMERIAAAVLDSLAPQLAREQARSWVDSQTWERFSDRLAVRVLKLAADDLPLDPTDTACEVLAERITRIADERSLKVPLDRLELRAAAHRALAPTRSKPAPLALLERVDSDAYREYASLALRVLSTRVKSAADHADLLKELVVAPHSTAFAEIYLRLLGERPADTFEEHDRIALFFWLGLTKQNPTWRLLGGMREPVLESFATRIGTMSGKRREELETELGQRHEMKDAQLESAWENFRERVKTLAPNWMQRTFGLAKAPRSNK